MSLRRLNPRLPSVYVAEGQYDRLSALADSSISSGASILGDELTRAIVIKDDEFPRDFVRLNSYVGFHDRTTGRARRVQIVAPDQADIDRHRLSVLTPVGAALIGLTRGAANRISTDKGHLHVLEVRTVESAQDAG